MKKSKRIAHFHNDFRRKGPQPNKCGVLEYLLAAGAINTMIASSPLILFLFIVDVVVVVPSLLLM